MKNTPVDEKKRKNAIKIALAQRSCRQQSSLSIHGAETNLIMQVIFNW